MEPQSPILLIDVKTATILLKNNRAVLIKMKNMHALEFLFLFQKFMHYGMFATSKATICHGPSLLPHHRLYPLCYPFYSCDVFIHSVLYSFLLSALLGLVCSFFFSFLKVEAQVIGLRFFFLFYNADIYSHKFISKYYFPRIP